jgi:predicted lipid-binding transport protein (Tim44 family)
MRLTRPLPAVLLAFALVLAPGLAMARAGFGGSFGSRGSRTYMAPPPTNTAPYTAAPLQRSLTPRAAPPAYGQPPAGYRGTGYGGSPFMAGLLGGFIGAGIGGLLFGHGLFGGMHGLGGFVGFLIQVFLIVLLVRWLLRRFAGVAAPAGGGGFAGAMPAGPRPSTAGASAASVPIGPQDYSAFETALREVQAAWSSHDLARMRAAATPEMVSYFADQMAEQASRGVRNVVSGVRLEQGDLAEAWSEGSREYATVGMRFSMNDVTRDAAGRVVDGSPDERVTATEIWTFMRAPGGRWMLSAVQQAR